MKVLKSALLLLVCFALLPLGSTVFAATPVTYAVTYDGNGNSGGSAPGGGLYVENKNVTVAGNTGHLVRSGYIFAGWYATDQTGTRQRYLPETTFIITQVINLHAQWTPWTDCYPQPANLYSGWNGEFDAVYLGKGGRVTEIIRRIPPNTALVRPQKSASMLLELPVKMTGELCIEEGDVLRWKLLGDG